MNDTIKFVLAVVIALALAEVAPEAVNALLILILVGMLLMRWKAFSSLVQSIGTLGK